MTTVTMQLTMPEHTDSTQTFSPPGLQRNISVNVLTIALGGGLDKLSGDRGVDTLPSSLSFQRGANWAVHSQHLRSPGPRATVRAPLPPPGGAALRAAHQRHVLRKETSQRCRMRAQWGRSPPRKMAPLPLVRSFSRLLAPVQLPSAASARTKFYVREPPNAKPNWLKVGLTLTTTAVLWFILIKQHNEDVLEYKRRNGLE